LWSDHGYFLGTRQGFHKTKFFERAARVPLLIFDSGRNLRSAQSVWTPVSTQDLFPTLLELGQVGNGNNQLNSRLVDGQSLVPYINGGSAPEQDVLSSFNFGQLWRNRLLTDVKTCADERSLAIVNRATHPSRAAGASYSLRWRDQDSGAVWRYTWYYQAGLFTSASSQVTVPNAELTQINPSTLEDGANLLPGNSVAIEEMRIYLKLRLESRIGRKLA